MSPIVDVHTHWSVGPETFPELTKVPAQPVVTPGGDIVSNVSGVPQIMYHDVMDVARQHEVTTAAGITTRLLSHVTMLTTFARMLGLSTLETARRFNDAGAELMARYPEISVLATVFPFAEGDLVELDRSLDELGMKGVVVDTRADGVFLDDPAAYPFWERIQDRDLTVFLHPPLAPIGSDSPAMAQYKLDEVIGRPFDSAMCAARLIFSGTLDRFPGLRLVLAHMGGGLLAVMGRLIFSHRLGYAGLPDDAAAKCQRPPLEYLRDNFYVDTMGLWPPHLKEAIEVFGSHRVLFGSDYAPVPLSPAEHVEEVRSLGLSTEDEERILWRNAVDLFRLEPRTY